MVVLLACLLWMLVAVPVVGGAILFRRLFPRESPWFGFIVPGLALVLVLNFTEYVVALPSLRWLGAIFFLVSVWLIISPRTKWRFLWLPTSVFLTAFTFTLFLRALNPDIAPIRDGIMDLHLVSDYCMGEKLPPKSTWLPGFRLQYYYALPHYAASVLIRLYGLDIGTGFNLSSALVSAFVYFLVAGIAWRVGRHKIWIVVVSVFLTASGMTGSSAYLWLAYPDHKDPDDATALLIKSYEVKSFPMNTVLRPIASYYDSHELIPPAYYTWMGGYHSVMTGQLMVFFGVYALVEMLRRRPTNVPWICSLGAVPLMIVTSTWGVPLLGAFFLGGLAFCAGRGIAPRNWRTVVIWLGIITLALTPMLLDLLRAPQPGLDLTKGDGRTQLAEFLIQWWPIYVPWYVLIFFWKRVHPAVRIMQVIVPIAFALVEFYTITDRYDMTGKFWGYIFAAGWAVFIPALATARSYMARGILVFFLIAGVLSMGFWIDYAHRSIVDDDKWHLDGVGDLRTEADKGRIFNILSEMNHRIVLTGKSVWDYNESPMMACLTHNTVYVAWSFHADGAFYPNSFREAHQREKEINDLYDGINPDPLTYLRERRISAVVIWPRDHIPADRLAALKAKLSPAYRYQDCRDPDAAPQAPQAGIFTLLSDISPKNAAH